MSELAEVVASQALATTVDLTMEYDAFVVHQFGRPLLTSAGKVKGTKPCKQKSRARGASLCELAQAALLAAPLFKAWAAASFAKTALPVIAFGVALIASVLPINPVREII